jgi:hypothetical protein
LTENISYQKAIIYSFITALIFSLLDAIILHPDLVDLYRNMAIYFLTPLICYCLAAVLATPGWLFRGKYEIKPLMIAALFCFGATVVSDNFLIPIGHKIGILFLFSFLGVILKFVSSLFIFPITFLTWFPHQWSKGTQRTGVAFAIIAGLITLTTDLTSKIDYQALFLENNVSMARTVAGKIVTTEELLLSLKNEP